MQNEKTFKKNAFDLENLFSSGVNIPFNEKKIGILIGSKEEKYKRELDHEDVQGVLWNDLRDE